MYYGWWIIGACFLIALYTDGVIFYGFTAFFRPIANEFGWSYTQISFAASLRGLELGLLAPIVGFLADRWGPRKFMVGGTIIAGIGLIFLSRVTCLTMFYGAYVLIAIGTSSYGSTVMIIAVVNWFRRKAGIAIGIVVSGFAVGGLLLPLVVLLIDTLGWRTAMFSFGLGMFIIGLPLSLLVRHKPEQYGYVLDGGVPSAVGVGEGLTPIQRIDVNIRARQALTSSVFWHIALALMYQSLAASAVLTHVMPYLSSIGIARSASSLVVSAIAAASIGGRLSFGWLGDRFDKRWIAAMGFALIVLGLLFFGFAAIGGMWMLLPFIILFGTGWGGNITMRSALVREYFGRSQFGTIHGVLIGVMMLGQIAGAPLAGWVFDKWSSYQGIWFVFAGLAIAALVTVATTPPVGKTTQPVEQA